ncbi:MAG: 1-acyl-sn-glycerol-3-phosphate acyltransferase [Planctomycetes bacterium]|nr:1-acyl-sn-glycerol-3-phosphate acyltransferase [Planctomycetota bacterium]
MSDRPVTSHSNPALTAMRFAEGVPSANLFYRFSRLVLHCVFASLWRTRIYNGRFEPAVGGALYVCNHQSFLDPILVGIGLRRSMNYMARASLFSKPFFGRVIRSANAFPVRRGAADSGALKEAMRRIKAGGQVVVFPEGTRTSDGRIGPFLPGLAFLARRSGAVTVPVVVDGAFECWPRTQLLPGPGNIAVEFGRPIPADQAGAMEPEEFIRTVRERMITIQADLRRRLGRPVMRYLQVQE